MYQFGLFIVLIGAVTAVYYGRPKIQVIKESTLDLKEKRQTDSFEYPTKTVLKIKMKGNRKQEVYFGLSKTTLIAQSIGYRNHISNKLLRLKANNTRSFNLDSDGSYSFIVQPYNNESQFIPFIIEYSILEINKRSPEMFQIGLTLFTTGFVIYFAS